MVNTSIFHKCHTFDYGDSEFGTKLFSSDKRCNGQLYKSEASLDKNYSDTNYSGAA